MEDTVRRKVFLDEDLDVPPMDGENADTSTPIYYCRYRFSYGEKAVVREKVSDLLQTGIIMESHSQCQFHRVGIKQNRRGDVTHKLQCTQRYYGKR